MKAFDHDGRSKTVQFKIAEDFNRLDLDDENMYINLYDLVQSYCANLATVDDSKPHHVGAVICTDCHADHDGHMAEDCPRRRERELNQTNRNKNAREKLERLNTANMRR